MQDKHLKYVLFLFIFVVALDFGLGNVYDYLYFTEKSRSQDRLIHSAVGTTEEVLVFGSSRAYHHYNPVVIEKNLGMSCFNVGYGGQNIYFHLSILKAAIIRKKPKIVILDILSIDFENTGTAHDKEKLGVLLPFVNKSTIYREAILSRGASEHIKLVSSIYPFNSKGLFLLRNNFTNQRSDVKGFAALSGKWKKPIQYDDNDTFEVDNSKLNALYEFIELCQKEDVKIHLFVSPLYKKLRPGNSYSFIVKDIYNKYGLTVNNFVNAKEFLDSPQLFADPAHLNKDGADLYSRIVSDKIKNDL